MSKVGLYLKMFAIGGIVCVGGPAFIYYVTPTEEELVKSYNPDLQRRSKQGRIGKQEESDIFGGKMRELARSNLPIWQASATDDAQTRAMKAEEQRRAAAEIQKRRDEIRKHSIGSG